MNDMHFFKSFRFNEYNFPKTMHRDNSKGVDFHFVGFMKHGKGRIVSCGQVLEIEENEMFYIPKGCPYHSYWIAEDYVRFDSIGFLFFPTTAHNGYKLQKINYDQELFRLFAPLSADKTVNASTIGILYSFLGALEGKLEPAPNSRDAAVYEQVVLMMKENPQLTIPQYAALCNVSASLLYHYIKKFSGKTPNRLRQEILCQKAEELLRTTGYSIEEICDRLSFSSGTYFRKVFESVYHKTPSQIRKEENMI